jgi:DNA-binding NtrC family response regulator
MAKFLVFDDDTTENISMLEQCLAKRHQTTFVASTEAVIAALEREKFDAVIANIYQETENVLGLLHRAKTAAWLQKLPFIVLRGPDAVSIAELDETVGMAMMMLGARSYVASDDYDSICDKLEKALRAPVPYKKPTKGRGKIRQSTGRSGSR